MATMPEPIAIIGSACRFPGKANTPAKLWELLRQPRDLSAEPPASRFNIDAFYHPMGTHSGTTNAKKSYWLEESVAQFDASFFNIQAAEAEAMDPQQRLLLEVVYDSLCSAGQPIEQLRGSDTAVYVGSMCDDYNTMLTRDWETVPRYAAMGLERGVLANRVSYFFDWHGPSMSIDTACSSSLVALDQAVQTLRSGKSKVAVTAGTSLILSPAMYISESMVGMLSPSGRCAMWDVAADGYARGEGVAAILIKPLSTALADNDPIQCVIRETAVNQDGRTSGLTVPSHIAQASLITECYARAGLDPIHNVEDRPQFFQAHGTGTQAGDPQEAEAISTALFPSGSQVAAQGQKLLVGSIKTIIGHTEGTAGVASVIASSLALKNGIVPPNLHFRTLNSKIAPFYDKLEIPTEPTAWPTAEGGVKRVSVNSFGFGGTNAHCILEEFVPQAKLPSRQDILFTPLVFSAASEIALRMMIASHLDYLKTNPNVHLASFAYTLQHRRSTFQYRKAVTAKSIQEVIRALEEITNLPSDHRGETDLGMRFSNRQTPVIIGIFTGQGAQWPRMGAELIDLSDFGASRFSELDAALQSLPVDRPTWTLKDQLLLRKETSRVQQAEISQPLCTAIQIVLVDILRAAGIKFAAVVGHSSGEIAAAYAAGFVSAVDAIRIAYFRGLHAHLAASPKSRAHHGAMLAVGTSFKDAQAHCQQMYADRIQVAAVNSSSSVTLSGDEDAIIEAEAFFESRRIFTRRLKVDTAYHSSHMIPCVSPYLKSLEACGVTVQSQSGYGGTFWFSSVYKNERMTQKKLTNQYWVDNMCNTVLFADALTQASCEVAHIDSAIEIGPHPALKGPATSVLDEAYSGGTVPYTGLLCRGQSDIEQVSLALGFIWTRLGSNSVQFSDVETLLSGNKRKNVLDDLPLYPFDHHREFWTTSRLANHFRHRRANHAPNPILGNPCSEAVTPGEFQWRNILCPGDLYWLNGHMLQGQMVFPATGYVSMATEAVNSLVMEIRPDVVISMLKLCDVKIFRAITFNDDSARVETIFSAHSLKFSDTNLTVEWACYSVQEGALQVVLNARGRAKGSFTTTETEALPLVKEDPCNMVAVREDLFYTHLSKAGYGYSAPFRGVSNILRKPGYSVGTLYDQSGSSWDDGLVCHPGILDSALQTLFISWSSPGDTNLWSLHIPVHFASITIDPYFTKIGGGGKQSVFQYQSFIRQRTSAKVVGDVFLDAIDGSHAFAQIEGAAVVPFSGATEKNDVPMFSQFHYQAEIPDGILATQGETLSDYDVQLYKDAERISYWYIRNVVSTIPADERHGLLPHYQRYLTWCSHMVNTVTRGEHPTLAADGNLDSRDDIIPLLEKYRDRSDVRFVQVVGDHLVDVIREGKTMLEHMNNDGLLNAFYADKALCAGPTSCWLARIVSQITFRHPGINILEVGAGTGATTNAILHELDNSYNSYTFTDISSSFFLPAEERFGTGGHRIIYKTFDMEKEPEMQGYVEGLYDVVVAVNVLHVSADVSVSLSNVRHLLKPGGYLVIAELTSTDLLFAGMTVGTLPGWWIGAESGRPWGPLLSLSQWDSALRQAGFSGIDTLTPDISASLPMSVFATQAINDQVSLLRSPLTVQERPEGIQANDLAIIGGNSQAVRKLVQDISQELPHQFYHKQTFPTLEVFARSDMALARSNVTVVSVTDLDTPYLADLTSSKLTALQTLWAVAGTVVWVTCGSREERPWSFAMLGITRVVRAEYPNLNLQVFDLEYTKEIPHGIRENTAKDLAETLLRQHVLGVLDTSSKSLLWTAEPEVFMENGKHMIARLLPDKEKNARYNSRRRDIYSKVDPRRETLRLVGTGTVLERTLELHQVSHLALPSFSTGDTRTIRITHSLLQNVSVGPAGFLRLCAGRDVKTNEMVLALSPSSESPAHIPSDWCLPLQTTTIPSTLVSVAANLMAAAIMSLTSAGGTLLVNEPDPAVQRALTDKARIKGITPIFTFCEPREDSGLSSILLHPHLPQQSLKSLVPSSPSVFVHFSRGTRSDHVKDSISRILPSACVRIAEETLLSHQLTPLPWCSVKTGVAEFLRNAWSDTLLYPSTTKVDCIPLAGISLHSAIGEPLAVIDWNASETVLAKVQPIDSGTIFRADRTYLFAGMAGELGQSLAEWMIVHGARHIVLASRSPKVNDKFVESMKRHHAAVVKFMSLDVTSRESLWSCHSELKDTLPPIAGVINGAMILDDELFANMKLEQFTRVTKPKVLGTELLDELFHDVALDFFIVASSIASVIGWRGQSNYSAANEYMTSLMNKRRNRGFHGAAINIPAVLGLGYAAHAENFDMDYFQSLGHININEEDLRQLVAEAMLSGRPDLRSETSAQVCMGVNYAPADFNFNEIHKRDVRFGHFVSREDAGVDIKTVASKVRVKVQLESAKSRQEYFGIIHDAFVRHLRRMLRIPEEENIEVSIDLVEVGIDSLVAVDIRAWFLKELEVDVPTLKILGGSSITELVQTAVEKFSPLSTTEEATSAAAATTKESSEEDSESDEHARNNNQEPAKALPGSRSSTASLSSRSTLYTPAQGSSSYARTPLSAESLDKKDAPINGKPDFKLPPAP